CTLKAHFLFLRRIRTKINEPGGPESREVGGTGGREAGEVRRGGPQGTLSTDQAAIWRVPHASSTLSGLGISMAQRLRSTRPVPASLQDDAFTFAMARSAGIGPGQLRGPGYARLHYGVYASRALSIDDARAAAAWMLALPEE